MISAAQIQRRKGGHGHESLNHHGLVQDSLVINHLLLRSSFGITDRIKLLAHGCPANLVSLGYLFVLPHQN